MTVMKEPHTRLLAEVIALGSPYPLFLTGGYAYGAHRLVSRPSQDLDADNPAPMDDTAATLDAGLEARCRTVRARQRSSHVARFTSFLQFASFL